MVDFETSPHIKWFLVQRRLMCRFVCLSGAQVMIVEVDRPVGVVRRGRSGVRFSADQIGCSVTTFLRSCAVQCPCVMPRRWIRHLLHASMKHREYDEHLIFWLVSAAVRIFCPVANLQSRREKVAERHPLNHPWRGAPESPQWY